MRKLLKRISAFTALLLLANSLTGLVTNAEKLPETAITTVTPDTPPAQTPAFHAGIEYSFQGYVVKGLFTETPPDILLFQPLYSLDGIIYQTCGEPWDSHWLKLSDDGTPAKQQNVICLYPNQEPLKSYLDKKLDRFFLKLRLVLQDGTTYDTQEALIDRGSLQPIPKELHPDAFFAPSLATYEMRPFCGYGKYQLTVCADSSVEEIASCLPDTLPIKISLAKGLQHVTEGIVDCPVTWKPLSLPRLAAGESVTIDDAAEEIVIPEGTLLNTPTGIFQLDEPLKLSDQYGLTDEVRLVLNVVSKDEAPTGALTAERAGLEMAFHLKPTGATSIQAYVWSKNSSAWNSLPDVPLLDAVNEQPSTTSSGYALVIGCDQEPYRSYLADQAAGNNPEPFLIGLTINGGIYDGRQLVLPWPDTYEIPLDLPQVGGSGGNELNAGSGNKNDSTSEGQRPDLPPDSKDHNDADKSPAIPPQNANDTLPALSATNALSETGTTRRIYSPSITGAAEKIYLPSITGVTEKVCLPSVTDTSPKTSLTHDDESSPENQRQEQILTLRSPVCHIQQPAAVQSSSTATAKRPDAVALTSFDQNRFTDAQKTVGRQKMPDRGTADKNRWIFVLLAPVTAAIIIAAASHRITADRKSIRILNILQKLHHKCRALARR